MKLRSWVFGAAIALVMAVGSASAASAQQEAPTSVQGGIGFINSTGVTGLVLGADVAFPIVASDKHPISAVAGVDFVHLSGIANALALGGGARVSFILKSKFQPYVQVLGFFVHQSIPDIVVFGQGTGETMNGFALAPGGGFVYPVSPKLKVFGQVDFPILFEDGGSTNAFRLMGGVVIPFGK